MSARQTNYSHPEAFCLMTYQCSRCSRTEVIWNSRDGVTPFGVACPFCDSNDMLHINWRSDRCVPDHQLKHGDRYFTDITLDEIKVIARMRVEIGSEYAPPPKDADERERIIQGIIDGFRPGEPTIKRYNKES